MRKINVHRHFRLGLALFGGLATSLTSMSDARAQNASSAGRPLPNVLLLVDNSGSMERKPDNNLPTCAPGAASEVNRWGMLLQAMTGNFQPYFSCAAVSRASNDFIKRYSINNVDPYDRDYFLPYHQPMTGSGANACVMSPWKLPGAGAGQGVGSATVGAGGNATDYPDDAIAAFKYQQLGTGLPADLTTVPGGVCTFDQNNDGQLDVSKAYARFALMTFDSKTERQTGLTGSYPTQQIDVANPFEGQWSYLRNTGNEFHNLANDLLGGLQGANGMPGTTPACPATFQEVGARNSGAPPWEGRLIPFAHPDATLYELDAQNALIQQTLLATRPYGATPIDGMMDDARDFLFNSPEGPAGTSAAVKDDYKCRDKYIVLLTDGAPNLNLRPSCEAANGQCPYPKKAEIIANDMFTKTDSEKVTTFVIGFSVNGVASVGNNDGFPTGLVHNDCKTWFDTAAGTIVNETQRAEAMETSCQSRKPEPGSTGEACCQLNKIALLGSGQGAYFAESQADIVLAFGRIMANIIHTASTKTVPAFSPAAQFSSSAFASNGSTASSAQFIASYIPSSQTPWAGELDRTRFVCQSNVSKPDLPLSRGLGDYQSENVAAQSAKKERLFISVLADKEGGAIDSAATIRPFSPSTADGIGNPHTAGGAPYLATEVVMKDYTLGFQTDWPLAMNITGTTCRAGRAVKRGDTTPGPNRGTSLIPALTDPAQCTDVVWGFATAYPETLAHSGYEFNTRCFGASTAADGTCSISDKACSPATGGCPTGETCVPKCAALGAIYHSTPAVVGPPVGLLREEGFRSYQAKYAKRRTTMYAATADGLLHAFDAMKQSAADTRHELWSFVPPAVLPRMAANYPGGNQILLDGAPVVREVVWDRTTTQLGEPRKWHTTLVAGLGTLGGYYAMNVTDSDCTSGTGLSTDDCYGKYQSPGKGTPADIGLPVDSTGAEGTQKIGPHFLWQITDVPAGSPEPAKIVRDSTLGATKMAALFGRHTGTPAIGTVQIKEGSVEHQVGIAILPGGYDEPPIRGGECDRATKTADILISDTSTGAVRTKVRQWAKGSCTTAPVPGRNVTIVRLDTGAVIRIFGRKQDTPSRLANKLLQSNGIEETLFDSPMVGTPVVYPDSPGVPIQKVFIGDADGTLWRIDLTSTNPLDWKAFLFADLMGKAAVPTPANSQPIQIAPVLALDDSGNIVVTAATGDQESIVANDALQNFVYSIRDRRTATGTPAAEILWYKTLDAAERVTGPMTVFDKTLYFASYKPLRPSGSAAADCNSPGVAYLWGMSYNQPKGAVTSGNGGVDRWCPAADIDTASGLCNTAYVDKTQYGNDIIPGVALNATQSCIIGSDQTDQYGNSMFSSISQAQYSLAFGIAKPNTGTNQAQAARNTGLVRPLPRMQTQISSWSLVLE